MKVFLIRLSFLMMLLAPTFTFAGNLSQEVLGQLSIREVVLKAQIDLITKGISSRAHPTRFVVDVIPASIIHRLIVVENLNNEDMDTGRITWLYDHIGKHGFKKLSAKVSNANAKGVLQLTETGFDYVLPLYRRAGIGASFTSAATDLVTSAKVVILFVDSALAALLPSERVKVTRDDTLFHDYVATAYNGGITHALRILRKDEKFIESTKQETREYVAKMRVARNFVHV